MRSLAGLLVALIAAGCGASGTDEPSGFAGNGGFSGGGGVAAAGGSGGASASGGGPSGGGGLGAAGGLGGVSGGGGAGGLGGQAGSTSLPPCVPMPKCDAPLPNVGPTRSWKHTSSVLIASSGFANHRARDLMLRPSDAQWVIGKFAYGVIDKDLKDEEVDIWLLRDCGTTWTKLGTTLTTATDGEHATVEGVSDSGGRVYFQIPDPQKLGIGRHRLRLVVAGDLSGADLYIEVLPPDTQFFATDVDGTLTTQETEEYGAVLTGSVSDAQPDAAAALTLLAAKGYRPFYLTARPEFLVGRTREFVEVHGFPLGLVHTTTALGALGSAAVGFKQQELAAVTQRGFAVDYAFGNSESDAEAFFLGGIKPADHKILLQYTDAAYGGRRIESYTELLAEFSALPPLCQ
jgi:hypothetical protein